MEKYFNPEGTYDKAIREKEVGVLRALLTGIVGSDPTFVTTEFEEAVKYIRNRSIDFNGEELILTEKYQKQEDEYEKAEEEWDEHYFQMNLVWLRDNFCLDKRLPLIKRVGKVVYKNKKTLGKSKAESRRRASVDNTLQRQMRSDSKKGKAVRTAGGGSEKKDRLSGSFLDKAKDYWWIILIVFAAVILLVVGD